MDKTLVIDDMESTLATERVNRLEAARRRLLDNDHVSDTPWLTRLMERKADDAAAEMRLMARQSVSAS